MRITYCIIFRLILQWTIYKDCQSFEVQTAEVCYGNTLSSFIDLGCGVGEVIQVRNTRAVAKLISTGCPVELTTLNENTIPDNCCINEPDDCGSIYTGSVYQNYYKRCHGNQNCVSLQASWVDITDTTCNQTEYLPRTNYMIFTYSCIPTSFIKSPCEGIQTTNTSVYIWNSGYPSQMAPGTDSCTCAAEIDCNATIAIRAIDLRFQDDSNTGLCGQGIFVTDGGSQTELGCASNNEFLETIVYTSQTDFITLEIKNTLSENGGYFWIEVFGQEEGAQITLSCGPSVISQPEIGDKTVCGKTTTTSSTTTSTTTTSITTATSSTITNTATSLTTDNSSNSQDNITSTLTTSDSSTETTTPAISLSTESSATSTTKSNSTTATPFSSTFKSPQNDSTSNASSSSSVPATLSSTTPAVNAPDQQTTPRDPQADAAKQTTDSGSSSPIGVIVAVVVVLVTLLAILIFLLCKRKQIKDCLCPNKVEDIKEDETDIETPEYDTMPNPLLTEGTLPLITGQAAASTDFPSLPGGGYIGKKPTLEPIRSPPKLDGNFVNLSSSLHYKLPKIENIQSSIRREKSSIGVQLVEEHRANPFPNVYNNFVTDQGRQSMLGETIAETNEEEGAANGVEMQERKMRKKRKRMMDRLNRIKTPMQSRSDSVKGFGSSTTRF